MLISGPVPDWLFSIAVAITVFTVMFDLGLAIVPCEFPRIDPFEPRLHRIAGILLVLALVLTPYAIWRARVAKPSARMS